MEPLEAPAGAIAVVAAVVDTVTAAHQDPVPSSFSPSRMDSVDSLPTLLGGSGSPAVCSGGRFWAIAPSEDEDLSGKEDAEVVRSRSYLELCRSPTPSTSRSFGSSSTRASRWMRKINAQRYASKTLSLFTDEDVSSVPLLPMRKTNFRVPKRPVLEPSVFVEEQDGGGWTVIHRRRRSSPPVKPRRWSRSPFQNSKNQNPRGSGGSRGNTWDRALKDFGPARPELHGSPSVGLGFGPRSAPCVCSLNTSGLGLRRCLGFTWKRVTASSYEPMAYRGGGRGGGGGGPGRGNAGAARFSNFEVGGPSRQAGAQDERGFDDGQGQQGHGAAGGLRGGFHAGSGFNGQGRQGGYRGFGGHGGYRRGNFGRADGRPRGALAAGRSEFTRGVCGRFDYG